MSAHAEIFTAPARGRGTHEITAPVAGIVRRSGIRTGTATVFLRHTSASLVIFENADPTARRDLERWMDGFLPDGAGWEHDAEGPDDMAAHLRMAITRTSETIPVIEGRLALGTWQGIYLFEHRRHPHTREVAVSVLGDP